MTPVFRSLASARLSAVLLVLLVALSGCADTAIPTADSPAPAPPADSSTPSPTDRATDPGVRAMAILAGWDAAREQAYARGSLAEVTALYQTPRLAAADRRLLSAYVARGLRITGMRRQVHEVHVRGCTTDRCTVLVRDRLASARVGTPDGSWQEDLPASAFRWREITLVRPNHDEDGSWVVATVRPGRPSTGR